ncbi:MAG: hypothetical protein ABH864_02430 [archaeon]
MSNQRRYEAFKEKFRTAILAEEDARSYREAGLDRAASMAQNQHAIHTANARQIAGNDHRYEVWRERFWRETAQREAREMALQTA